MFVCLGYNKANRVLVLIRRTIINKEPRQMMSLYKTLVRPHVDIVQVHGAQSTKKIRS